MENETKERKHDELESANKETPFFHQNFCEENV